MHVWIEISSVLCEMIENFDLYCPVVVGGLFPAEERFGYSNKMTPLVREDAQDQRSTDLFARVAPISEHPNILSQ